MLPDALCSEPVSRFVYPSGVTVPRAMDEGPNSSETAIRGRCPPLRLRSGAEIADPLSLARASPRSPRRPTPAPSCHSYSSPDDVRPG